MKNLKKLLIILIISFSFFTLNLVNADSTKNEIIAYNKVVAKLNGKNLVNNLLSLNKQLKTFLITHKNEKAEVFYKLNNNKLKSLLSENEKVKYLQNKGYTIYFIDGSNKLLIDDGTWYNGVNGDKILSPQKGYAINEGDLENTFKSHPEISMKYALYNLKGGKIYLTDSIISQANVSINELKLILPYVETQFTVGKDLGVFQGGISNGEYYLYKYNGAGRIDRNYLSFFDNNLTFLLDNIKNYTLQKDKDGVYYAVKLDKYDIGPSSLYENISNKDEVMYLTANNILWYKDFNLNDLQKIKDTTLEVIKNSKTDEEKVKAIYDYLISSITYDYDTYKKDSNASVVTEVSNPSAYNGIGTFRNKTGVCNGYAELMYYMLSFAGISDVEKIDGKVTTYDNAGGGNHSWIRIGGNYYDPTFDSTLKNNPYKYYALNKDVMLGDRVEGTTSNSLTLEQVFNNYLSLSTKYDFNILTGYKKLSKLGIKDISELNTDNLKEKLGEITDSSQIMYGGRMYTLHSPTYKNYLGLLIQLGEYFPEGKIYMGEGDAVNFVVRVN